MQNEKPRILVKTKNLQLIFDYCIESKTEFTVIPRNSDDWEIELSIRSIIDAVRWGMFLKANKIELLDTQILVTPTANRSIQVAPVQKTRKERAPKQTQPEPVVQNTLLEMSSNPEKEKTEVVTLEENVTLDFTESKESNELF